MSSTKWDVPAGEVLEFRAKATKYCAIIPILNEGERIQRQLVRMNDVSGIADIVIVDGGSTDGALTEKILIEQNVRAFLKKTGPGRLSAQLRLGLSYAINEGYEGCILIDGNNKDNPAAIPDFVNLLEEGCDHVQGSRFIPGGVAINTPPARLWGIRLLHAPLISLSAGFCYTDTTNGFRAYSRKFLLDPRVQPFRDVFSCYELHYYLAIRAAELGFRVVETPVERSYPVKGKVPTKIKGLRGNLKVLKTLFKACFHKFDPPSSDESQEDMK